MLLGNVRGKWKFLSKHFYHKTMSYQIEPDMINESQFNTFWIKGEEKWFDSNEITQLLQELQPNLLKQLTCKIKNTFFLQSNAVMWIIRTNHIISRDTGGAENPLIAIKIGIKKILTKKKIYNKMNKKIHSFVDHIKDY